MPEILELTESEIRSLENTNQSIKSTRIVPAVTKSMNVNSQQIVVKKKKSPKRSRNFSDHIFKVFNEVHPKFPISTKAMEIMNSFVGDMFERLSNEASKLAARENRKIITSSDIQTAVLKTLTGELAKHAVFEGDRALRRFYNYKS